MRDPKRIDKTLEEIGRIWREYPEMRLGQLIGNVLEGPALYYVEDDGLLRALRSAYEDDEKQPTPINFDVDAYVFDLIKKHPDELGFVLQENDYAAYKRTYVDAGGKADDAELTEAEFDALKAYFRKEE